MKLSVAAFLGLNLARADRILLVGIGMVFLAVAFHLLLRLSYQRLVRNIFISYIGDIPDAIIISYIGKGVPVKMKKVYVNSDQVAKNFSPDSYICLPFCEISFAAGQVIALSLARNYIGVNYYTCGITVVPHMIQYSGFKAACVTVNLDAINPSAQKIWGV